MTGSSVFGYSVIPDLSLIIEYYKGKFEYKDIYKLKNTEMKEPGWKNNFDVLGDIRSAMINLTEEDLLNFQKYHETNIAINTDRKSAILPDRPEQVVFGTILKDLKIKESFIIPKVFSTIEAAITWLGINPIETDRINDILENLAV